MSQSTENVHQCQLIFLQLECLESTCCPYVYKINAWFQDMGTLCPSEWQYEKWSIIWCAFSIKTTGQIILQNVLHFDILQDFLPGWICVVHFLWNLWKLLWSHRLLFGPPKNSSLSENISLTLLFLWAWTWKAMRKPNQLLLNISLFWMQEGHLYR